MKYNELIKKISQKMQFDEETVKNILGAFLEEVTDSLTKGEEVQLWGFGKFERRTYNERRCYNPIRNEVVKLHSSYAPVFKPGVKLRKTINK